MLESRTQRGFTLMEMVIVIAVVGILGSLASYAMGTAASRRSVHDAARAVVGELHRVRTTGVSARYQRTTAGTGPLNASLSGATASVQQTGLRVDDDRTLTFFGDIDDLANGNEQILRTLDLARAYPKADLRVTVPAVGSQIRFARNSTLVGGAEQLITLRNEANGMNATIRISLAGVPRIL